MLKRVMSSPCRKAYFEPNHLNALTHFQRANGGFEAAPGTFNIIAPACWRTARPEKILWRTKEKPLDRHCHDRALHLGLVPVL